MQTVISIQNIGTHLNGCGISYRPLDLWNDTTLEQQKTCERPWQPEHLRGNHRKERFFLGNLLVEDMLPQIFLVIFRAILPSVMPCKRLPFPAWRRSWFALSREEPSSDVSQVACAEGSGTISESFKIHKLGFCTVLGMNSWHNFKNVVKVQMVNEE